MKCGRDSAERVIFFLQQLMQALIDQKDQAHQIAASELAVALLTYIAPRLLCKKRCRL